MRLFLIVAFSLVLGACASQPPREVRTGEIYIRHAAEAETTSVMYSFVRSWRRAGDDSVLIEFNGRRHYLFQLEPRCATEIPFANAIALMTSSSRRVDRFDRIRVDTQTCRITSIREVDFQAVQAELAALRQPADPALETIEVDLIHADDYSGGT